MRSRPDSPVARRALADESGVVWGLVAVALPLLLILAAFAIDVGHWYDYKRSLQNRADAAALAGGDAYGSTCFSDPPLAGGLTAIGQNAVGYGGPASGSQVPAEFPYAALPAVYNVTNLKAASLADYWIMLNSTKFASDPSATNYDMSATGTQDPGAFCKSTDEDGNTGPMLDVRVTQKNIPLFFKLPFGLLSHINAHARVSVQGILGERPTPIAVRDAGYTPCVSVRFVDDTTGAPLTLVQNGQSVTAVKLTNQDPSVTPAVWTNTGAPASLTMPNNTDHVSVETDLNNCSRTNPGSQVYRAFDDSANGNNNGVALDRGLAFINNYPAPSTPPANQPPVITSGGVTLTGPLGGACDPYFFTSAPNGTSCTVGVQANVAFPSGLQDSWKRVTATIDPGTQGATTIQLTQAGAGSNVWSSSPGGFTVGLASGAHPIAIGWSVRPNANNTYTINGTTCKNNNPCTDTFGIQQRTVAGLNGENACGEPTFDTGPNMNVEVGSGAASMGVNAFQRGSTQPVTVTATIAGLANAGASDPPVCLRLNVQQDHTTGVIDCGEQLSQVGVQDAIRNGCPNPVQVHCTAATQGGCALNGVPRFDATDGSLLCPPDVLPNSPIDCVVTESGAQRPPILQGFADKVNCSDNLWGTGAQITLDDPRSFVMIITAPADLAADGNIVPIRQLAVFYVTGWATGQGGVQSCNKNDPYPGGNGNGNGNGGGNQDNGKVWGHWTSVTVPSGSGTGNGDPCTNTFGNCIPVLTR